MRGNSHVIANRGFGDGDESLAGYAGASETWGNFFGAECSGFIEKRTDLQIPTLPCVNTPAGFRKTAGRLLPATQMIHAIIVKIAIFW